GEARDRPLRECLVGKVAQRITAPEAERRAERVAVAVCDELLEAVEIELSRRDTDQVARPTGLDPVRPERTTETRGGHVHRRDRRRRLVVVPQLCNQTVNRHDVVPVQEEQREERALLRAAQRKRLVSVPGLERPEDPVLHCVSLVLPFVLSCEAT